MDVELQSAVALLGKFLHPLDHGRLSVLIFGGGDGQGVDSVV